MVSMKLHKVGPSRDHSYHADIVIPSFPSIRVVLYTYINTTIFMHLTRFFFYPILLYFNQPLFAM